MSGEALDTVKVKLGLFSQSTFPAPVTPNLLATSPTLNLAAAVTNANTLTIHRAGGELVSSSSEKGRAVQALCWKADGQFLAVAWDDGTVRLLGVENTKVVHRINVAQRGVGEDAEPPLITHVAWARNLTGKRHFSQPVLGGLSDIRLQGQIDGVHDDSGELARDQLADLPHALTFLEIDTSLPKISPLPVSGGTGDDMFVFSTTASLESMFAPLKREDNDVVDVMIVGTRDGCIHLSIYDSFPVGSFKVPVTQGVSPASSQAAASGDYQFCLHTSHPEISTHGLLLRSKQDEKPKAMYLVPMDLRFVSYSPVNLSLLASKTTTLQKLLRYIRQTQIHLANEWQSTRELPSRFFNFIQQDLQKAQSGPTNLVQALYHTVLTGHVYPPVREWLVDSIGDRGHIRWEKAVIPGLQNLRNLLHENMLPALERTTLILSRLSGIARFHEQDDYVGFSNTDITRLVDVLTALNLVCHKALLIVMEELDLFRMFSSWVRITIDRVSTSNMSDEIMEKEALLDPAKVLRYIERYLVTSPLALFFEKLPQETYDKDRASVLDCSKVLDEVDQQLRNEERGKPFKKALPQMRFLVDLLAHKAEQIFETIADARKRDVRFGQAVKLELLGAGATPETINLIDVRMCAVPKSNGVDGIAYAAMVSEEKPHTVEIFESKIEIINGVSSAALTELAMGSNVDPDKDGRIIDVKFLSDEVLVVLCQKGGQPPVLISTLFREASRGLNSGVTRFELETNLSKFVPIRMEAIAANESRGGVPARVCLIGQNGMSYKVFALLRQDDSQKIKRDAKA